MEEFWKPARPPCHCSWPDTACVSCEAAREDICVMEEGKKVDTSGEMEGADVQVAQQKAHFHPSRAERKGRAWKAFPTREMDALFGQLFFLLSLLIICSAYSQERLKQNRGLCVPPGLP